MKKEKKKKTRERRQKLKRKAQNRNGREVYKESVNVNTIIIIRSAYTSKVNHYS